MTRIDVTHKVTIYDNEENVYQVVLLPDGGIMVKKDVEGKFEYVLDPKELIFALKGIAKALCQEFIHD